MNWGVKIFRVQNSPLFCIPCKQILVVHSTVLFCFYIKTSCFVLCLNDDDDVFVHVFEVATRIIKCSLLSFIFLFCFTNYKCSVLCSTHSYKLFYPWSLVVLFYETYCPNLVEMIYFNAVLSFMILTTSHNRNYIFMKCNNSDGTITFQCIRQFIHNRVLIKSQKILTKILQKTSYKKTELNTTSYSA